ncbi:MAG: helix-turn-helix domain-containing protein [Proteobacteria bacterium]|nr:helix-turn-helix domain-containing protein [Pseudomonadota bacterium]
MRGCRVHRAVRRFGGLPVVEKTVLPPSRRTISIPQAVETMGISRRTIYNWIAKGRIEYCRTASGLIRIYADTLYRDADMTLSNTEPQPERSFL